MKHLRPTVGFFLSLVLLVFSSLTAWAQTTNALDRIDFGNTTSEAAHSFDAGLSPLPLSGVGAFGQTYRRAWGASGNTTPSTALLQFTLKCDPNKQNYVTVKAWGSDRAPGDIVLQGSTISDPVFDSNYGTPLEYPNRWIYNTAPIPLAWTQGKTTVQLTFVDADAAPGRKTYSAYTHTEPRFIPDASEAQGVKPVQPGFLTPVALTSSQVIALLQTNRQNIYGPGGYYSQMLARQVMPTTSGAPPETVGLDFWGTVSGFSGTPDQWRDQIGGGEHGPGYSTVPDEMLSVLWSTYALPPFKDASGSTVTGLDHYHDATILTRLVSCLDGSTYLQSSDGSFNRNANNASGVWQGLTSTPRAAGHPYAGSTARGTGWSLSLEGVDTGTLGTTILSLLNDPTAGPSFRASLSQSYDADMNGGSMLRAYAYERMLSSSANYLYGVNGGTESQNLIEELGMYSAQLALAKLQTLYPNSSYPGVGSAAAATRMQMVLGLVPESGMGGTDPSYYGGSAFNNYGLTVGGFGEAHGSLSSGYDGRYGTIEPWLAARFAQLAAQDPTVSTSVVSKAQAAARTTVDGFVQFISPLDNTGYNNDVYYDNFTLAQEDFITYRDTYMPNANGNSFMVLGEYLDSDPTGPINDRYALRSAYLEGLYGKTPVLNAGGSSSVNYLRDLSAYEATLRSLIGVDPSTLKPLPGEPGQPNHAMVDAQSGATAIYYNGERLYMNANWDNFENNNNRFLVSNLARIHDTVGTLDRAAEIIMPHDATTVQNDGNLSGSLNQGWVVRYGPYLMAGNNSTSNIAITLPAGTGSALELVSGNSYALGSTVTLAPGVGAAFVLPGAGSSGNGTAPLLADGYYTLTNQSSGLLLDDKGNGGQAALVDQAATTNGLGQKWLLTNLGNNNVSLVNGYSALAMEVQQGSTTSGAPIDQWGYVVGSTNEIWHLTSLSNGYYTLTAQNSGMVLDDPGGSNTPGTGMIQWPSNAGTNQQWALTPVSLIPNGTYTLTNPASGLAFDASGGMTPEPPTGATSQQWQVTNYGGSLLSFADLADHQFVQVLYGYTGAGSRLAGSGTANGANVVWQVSPGGNGQITLTGLASSLLAEIPSGGTAGSQLDIGLPLGTANQQWTFKTITQINAGGSTVSPFLADMDFSGGNANSTTATIDTSASGSAPAAVYQTGRYGAFTYTIPGLIPSANYTVRLHFAETYWTSAGSRIENVTINGVSALSNFDIFAAAGAANKAVVKVLTATADSLGHITIAFAGSPGSPDGNALVAGLEVLPQ